MEVRLSNAGKETPKIGSFIVTTEIVNRETKRKTYFVIIEGEKKIKIIPMNGMNNETYNPIFYGRVFSNDGSIDMFMKETLKLNKNLIDYKYYLADSYYIDLKKKFK